MLPLVLENFILEYYYGLEHFNKFKKTLEVIKNIERNKIFVNRNDVWHNVFIYVQSGVQSGGSYKKLKTLNYKFCINNNLFESSRIDNKHNINNQFSQKIEKHFYKNYKCDCTRCTFAVAAGDFCCRSWGRFNHLF